jgi:hypothetical protein
VHCTSTILGNNIKCQKYFQSKTFPNYKNGSQKSMLPTATTFFATVELAVLSGLTPHLMQPVAAAALMSNISRAGSSQMIELRG